MTRHRLTGGFLALLAALAFLLMYSLRYALIPLALAAGVAYILTPVIAWLQKRARAPRFLVAVAFYVIVVGSLGILAWRDGARIYADTRQFLQNGTEQMHDFIARVMGGKHFELLGKEINADNLSARIQEAAKNSFAKDPILRAVGMAVGTLLEVVLFLVLLFYFLLQGPRLARGFVYLTPPEYRAAMRGFAAQAHPLLLRYMAGMVLIVLFVILIVWLATGPVLHLAHAVLLAITVGLLELLPVLGPALSAVLLFAAVLSHGAKAWTLIGFGVFLCVLRLFIDQVLGPVVLGRAVRLPAAVLILALVAGGILLGPLGVLLAIPATALVKLALDNYYSLPVEEPPK